MDEKELTQIETRFKVWRSKDGLAFDAERLAEKVPDLVEALREAQAEIIRLRRHLGEIP